jgi:hypothetical protein
MKKSALLATLLAALSLSACGGGTPAVCDEYKKAIEDAKGISEDAKAGMKQQFEEMKKLPSDQQEMACKGGLTGLQNIGTPSPEAAAEAAQDAADDAKEAAADAKEAAADAKEEAKDAADAAK